MLPVVEYYAHKAAHLIPMMRDLGLLEDDVIEYFSRFNHDGRV
jgi:hypothetical protein